MPKHTTNHSHNHHTTSNTSSTSTNNHNHNQQVFESFKVAEELTRNTPLSSAAQTTLASLNILTDSDDNVLLTATIGWVSTTNVTIIFRILRDNIEIFQTQESVAASTNRTTSFSWVDTNILNLGDHLYSLTAQIKNAGEAATVIGPVVLTAAEIDK